MASTCSVTFVPLPTSRAAPLCERGERQHRKPYRRKTAPGPHLNQTKQEYPLYDIFKTVIKPAEL